MLSVLLLTTTLYQYLLLLFSAKPCRWWGAPGCRCCSWRPQGAQPRPLPAPSAAPLPATQTPGARHLGRLHTARAEGEAAQNNKKKMGVGPRPETQRGKLTRDLFLRRSGGLSRQLSPSLRLPPGPESSRPPCQ